MKPQIIINMRMDETLVQAALQHMVEGLHKGQALIDECKKLIHLANHSEHEPHNCLEASQVHVYKCCKHTTFINLCNPFVIALH